MITSVSNSKAQGKGSDDLEKLAISLKAAIVNTGLKRPELAEILGIAEGTLSNWCSGVGQPSVLQLQTISRLSGIPMDFIFLPEKSNTN